MIVDEPLSATSAAGAFAGGGVGFFSGLHARMQHDTPIANVIADLISKPEIQQNAVAAAIREQHRDVESRLDRTEPEPASGRGMPSTR